MALNWSVVSVIDEFERNAGSEGNWFDVQFIESFGMDSKSTTCDIPK